MVDFVLEFTLTVFMSIVAFGEEALSVAESSIPILSSDSSLPTELVSSSIAFCGTNLFFSAGTIGGDFSNERLSLPSIEETSLLLSLSLSLFSTSSPSISLS